MVESKDTGDEYTGNRDEVDAESHQRISKQRYYVLGTYLLVQNTHKNNVRC